MNRFDLTGKRALVTGSSRGIGRALAEALLEAGATVVINGVSDQVQQTAAELSADAPGRVFAVQADLSQRPEVQRLFDEALQKLGGLDILFVNHGIQHREKAEDFPLEKWDSILEVNLSSVFMIGQLAGQHMLTNGGGKIINIASLISFIGGMRVPAYAAAKGGVAQVTKAFSNEWTGRGVTVNAIVPGYIHTDMTDDLVHDSGYGASLLARIPAGRWGTPDDLKGIAIFLASSASDYISGAIIPVDGGFLVR
jgi:2-dehydro-3-deoxy-D-gluconate 5-dehydrogenase